MHKKPKAGLSAKESAKDRTELGERATTVDNGEWPSDCRAAP
jgi:hypothetical protein